MNHVSTSAADCRQSYRLAIHRHARLTFSLDGPEAKDDAIHGVTLTDISREDLMATDEGHLVPGALVLLDVPLVGWREAEVRWIADNRAGCRFSEPLDLEELRLAAASSARLAGECPALAEAIARMPPLQRPAPAVTPPVSPVPVPSWRSGALLLSGLAIASFFAAGWLLDHLI